jgi:drug/metabolite transporter (DMT)-like permease
MERSRSKEGIALAIAAYGCYAIAALFVKLTSIPFHHLVFYRSLVGLCLFFPFLLKSRERLKTHKAPLHFLRTLISLTTIYCSTYGIQLLSISDAILLEQTAPFFIPGILYVWKRETTSLVRCISIAIGFLGVALILMPSLQVWKIGAFASLGAGFLVAVSIIFMKELLQTEHPYTTLFYFFLFSSCLTSFPVLRSWKIVLSWPVALPLFAMGMFFTLFQLLLTKSLVRVKSQVVGSYACLAVFFSFLLEELFFQEQMTGSRLCGAILIIGAGVFAYRLENKNQRIDSGGAQQRV